MRYLRMLSNSVAAACVATAYVLILVVLLNPALSLHPVALAPLATTVGLFYVFNLTMIGYILLVLGQLLAREVFSPAWISVGVLVWLSAMAAAAGATLMWRNLVTFALVLDEATATALERSAYVLAATSILCLGLAFLRRRAPRARGLWASLLAILVVSSVAALLALRGRGTPPLLEARPIDAAFDMARNE